MTLPDSGVDLLLRRATDDLRPDVDRLVAAGITRGRTRQRRVRIGTAVAAVAVFGVIGAGAAVVPQLGPGPDSASDPIQPATSTTPTPTAAATTLAPATLSVVAADIPEIVDTILATDLAAAGDPDETGGDERSRTSSFLYAGMLTTVTIEKGSSTIAQCSEVACVELSDGSTFLEWGPTVGDGVTAQGVTWWRRGYQVSAISYNAAEGKESPPLASEPPLSLLQLRVLAGTDVWFS